jgi:hypothetical protein
MLLTLLSIPVNSEAPISEFRKAVIRVRPAIPVINNQQAPEKGYLPNKSLTPKEGWI